MHGLLVGHFLAHELLAIYFHDLVTSQEASTLCRAVLDDSLNVDGVFTDHELDAYSRERALQVVGCYLGILGRDIDGVGVEVGENLRDGYVNK